MTEAPWRSPEARARRVGLGVVLLLGALDAWFFQRWNVDPDGVSYLDLARAFAAHGPRALLNGYWSPLFPAAMGTLFRFVPPTMETMYRLAHALGFALYVATCLTFYRLVSAIAARSRRFASATPAEQVTCVALAWAAYALLVLKGVGVRLLTPDMGVCLVAFWLAAGMLSLNDARWPARRWLLLGLLLGAAYWWKAILLPVGVVAFAGFVLIAWRRHDGWRGPGVAVIAYGAVALALIIPVSRLTGRATFGETGRLNFLWYVNNAPYVWERCRDPRTPDAVAARYGSIRLDSVMALRPLTCALPEPAPEATMPLWYDPSLWYRGTHGHISIDEELRSVRNNVRFLVDAFALGAPVLFPAFLCFGILALAWGARATAGVPLGMLVSAPFAFYLLVYVELRHVAPFVLIGCAMVPFALLQLGQKRRHAALALLALLVLGDAAVQLSEQTLIELTFARRALQGRLGDRDPESLHVARALRARGLEPGMRVASINNLWNPEWAQLAGLRVRAQVPDLSVSVVQVAKLLADACTEAAWAAGLRQGGIEAVVAKFPTGIPLPPGFLPVQNTGFSSLRLVDAPLCPSARDAATRASLRTGAR